MAYAYTPNGFNHEKEENSVVLNSMNGPEVGILNEGVKETILRKILLYGIICKWKLAKEKKNIKVHRNRVENNYQELGQVKIDWSKNTNLQL